MSLSLKTTPYRDRFGTSGGKTTPLTDSYRRIVHGETLQIGEHYWQGVARYSRREIEAGKD